MKGKLKRTWINTALIALFTFSIVACSSEDDKDAQFCTCMEAGENFNESSKKMWKGNPTSKDVAKHKKLKEIQKKECKGYQRMSGKAMLKRKAACGKK